MTLGCHFRPKVLHPLLLEVNLGAGSLQAPLGWRRRLHRKGDVATGTSFKKPELSGVNDELSPRWMVLQGKKGGRVQL